MRTHVGSHISQIWSSGGPFMGPDGKPHGRVTIQDGSGDTLHTTTAKTDPGAPYTTTQVRSLYGRYGFITDEQIAAAVHLVTGETADDRVARNAYELNNHLRDWANLEVSIRDLPGANAANEHGSGTYATRGVPLRWFQDAANSQVEIEVPNIKSIEIQRSVDQDAATLSIVMYNQKMGTTGEGKTGYFTPTRGDTIEGRSRWGYGVNEWHNKLVPNAILRTYQGYGGNDKTIPQAQIDGNIVLTGIWFIDSVSVRTDGMLEIKARDPMKLLLEQQLYPPLVPRTRYPLKYYRWQYTNEAIHAAAVTIDGESYEPIFLAADSVPSLVGYITSDGSNDIDAFGDGALYDRTGGTEPDPNLAVTSVRSTRSGNGYYVLNASGQISCYGDAVYHGDPFADGYIASNGFNGVCFDMAVTHTGGGYWVQDTVGHTFAFGDAPVFGSQRNLYTVGTNAYLSIESHPTKMAYWVMDSEANIFFWPDAATAGDFGTTHAWQPPLTDGGVRSVCIRTTPSGNGYWILTTAGQVATFGDADFHGGIANPEYHAPWREAFWKLIPQTGGYLLLRGDGRIFPAGDAASFGNVTPGQQSTRRIPGNYLDYVDIIRDLLLWSGFTLFEIHLTDAESPSVYGNLESTGSWSEEPLPDNIFDKRPVIEAIHEIKETVGYFCWCDDEGAIRFESPNWWKPGNFDEFGVHLNTLPEVDERVNLTNYSISVDDSALRSMIIISSEDPDQGGTTTLTTRVVPKDNLQLRGLVKPAMWVNGFFQKRDEQKVMAELIALHIHFQARLGSATCAANPLIGINDQVRIFERQTNDAFIHYVRGITSTMDLDTGSYTMSLTTSWLGTKNGWGLSGPGQPGATWGFELSDLLSDWEQGRATNPARVPRTSPSTDPYGGFPPNRYPGQDYHI